MTKKWLYPQYDDYTIETELYDVTIHYIDGDIKYYCDIYDIEQESYSLRLGKYNGDIIIIMLDSVKFFCLHMKNSNTIDDTKKGVV